jgi:hypothetical protein
MLEILNFVLFKTFATTKIGLGAQFLLIFVEIVL